MLNLYDFAVSSELHMSSAEIMSMIKKRKTVLFLIFEHSDEVSEWRIDEMLNQSQIKICDEVR